MPFATATRAYSLKDKRKSSRFRIGAQAWLRLDGGFAVRPCQLIDRSETGAQISVDMAASMPSRFNILTSRSTGSGQPAQVKWRRGSHIGVMFVEMR